MIIDAHTHLGNILYPDGGRLIHEKGVKKKFVLDPVTLSEMMLHVNVGNMGYSKPDHEGWLHKLVVKADHARNLTATRENMRKAMNRNKVDYCAVMPIPPYVAFSDLRKAAEKDPGILPFTGVDYSREYNLKASLDEDVRNGAKGMKLHPIIQNWPLTHPKTFEAVEAFAGHDLPILFHCGISHYYTDEQEKKGANPEYGAILYAAELVKAFPQARFIAGHAGLFQINDVMEMLGDCDNVWVDISIQSPKRIRRLLDVFGPDKVLNASDWPWGNMKTSLRAVKWACKGDRALERKILFENAAELMKLK